MIKEFSGGYYRALMTVQPYEDGPSIESGLYDMINRKIYSKTDAPVTMRLSLDGGPRFSPDTESAIPTNVIGVPRNMLDEAEVHPSDENAPVYILKPQHAFRFYQGDL